MTFEKGKDKRTTLSKPGTRERTRKHPDSPTQSPEEILFVREVLRSAGLEPEEYRLSPLLRRIPACLRALKAASLPGALKEITTCAGQLSLAVNALLNGTTGFFRDRPVFEVLEEQIIPNLMRRRSSPRVWSAACSDGAELYSVAMMFAKRGLRQGHFRGTDCRASAISRAVNAVYPSALLDDVPQEYAEEFFVRAGDQVSVRAAIQSGVKWERNDLLGEGKGSSSWDMILCRNLAIYLEPDPMARLWERLSAELVPGGYLIVGRAEKPQLEGFVRLSPCIYQKATLPIPS